jgi:hypothetical protein
MLWGANMVKRNKGAKVEIFFEGLNVTSDSPMLMYNHKLYIFHAYFTIVCYTKIFFYDTLSSIMYNIMHSYFLPHKMNNFLLKSHCKIHHL